MKFDTWPPGNRSFRGFKPGMRLVHKLGKEIALENRVDAENDKIFERKMFSLPTLIMREQIQTVS